MISWKYSNQLVRINQLAGTKHLAVFQSAGT